MAVNIPNLETIFSEAVEIASEQERAAYLDRACAADPDLRREVESLIAAHDRSGRFLASPTVSFEQATSEPVGTTIGPYKLMEQIGEGGMGVVYVAEQQVPVRRKVALKVIKPGMDTRQVIARFEAERQALAMMDHPTIAKIFDGGVTESGRPYFVMELVRGLPLTEYCDGEKLLIRERLELFVLVCRAVQHAHQKGIIHRDLKPSNILVTIHDGVPVPKVIDFGVAKATGQSLTEKTVYTAFTQLVGTPLYMSPEQVELSGLDIDTRSDIYSLGVLLYELLTGTTPFDGEALRLAAFDEMRRIIREDEPQKPSARLSSLGATLMTTSMKRSSDPRHLNRSVRGELDWIAMKALEKDRKRRYETANDFAADVTRYLTDQPVEACPPSALYRFRKFARRNRAVLTTATLVVAALFMGAVVSTWQAVRATKAKRAEATQRRRAEANFEKAREAVDQMLTRVADRLNGVPRLEKLRGELLQEALTFHQGFLQEQIADPEVRFQTAIAYYQIARIQRTLGQSKQSEQSWRHAIRISEELTTDFPDNAKYRGDLGSCRLQLGWVLGDQGRLREAEALFRQSGSGWSLLSLTEILIGTGRLAEAEVTCQKALAFSQQDVLSTPTHSDRRLRLGQCYNILGEIQSATGRPDDAEKSYRQALEIFEKLVEDSPSQVAVNLRDLAKTHNLLGDLMNLAGRLPEAEKAYRASAAVSEKLVTDFPNTPSHWYYLARDYGRLSYLLRKTDRLKEAEEAARKAAASYEKLMADFPDAPHHRDDLAADNHNWGVKLTRRNRPRDAEQCYRQAHRIREKLAADFPRNERYAARLGSSLGTLACTLSEMGRHAEANKLARQSLALAEKGLVDFPNTADHQSMVPIARQNLGIVQYRDGDYKAAIASLEKTLGFQAAGSKTYREEAGVLPDKGAESEARLFLAMSHWRLGHQDEARTLYDQAVEGMEKNQPRDEELRRFRAEAAELLNVRDEPKSGKQPPPK